MLHGKFDVGLLGLRLPHLQQTHPSSSSALRLVVRSAFVAPIAPDQLWPQNPIPIPKPALEIEESQTSSRPKSWRIYARSSDEDDNTNNKKGRKRWFKCNESSLHKHEPLPLPMTYPGSTPNLQDVENMMNCNTEKEDCKDVLYQWTGKCSRCHGTGEVSYYPKKGREIICKCIPCMGIGYVHKMTVRTDLDVMEDLDGGT